VLEFLRDFNSSDLTDYTYVEIDEFLSYDGSFNKSYDNIDFNNYCDAGYNDKASLIEIEIKVSTMTNKYIPAVL